MANYRVAKRYAKGLYQFSSAEGKTDEIYAEMQELSQLISESPDLQQFLKTPILDFRKKQTIAQQIFKSYSKEVQQFIQLVILHGRESNLKEISQAYLKWVEEQKGIQRATLISAVELDPNTVSEIIKKSGLIKDMSTYKLTQKIDASLIGGYILEVGDKQVDASVKNRFNQLRENFEINNYIPKI